MAYLLGVDIGDKGLRVVLVRASYRRISLEGTAQVQLSDYPSLAEALKAATSLFPVRPDGTSLTLDGDKVFIRTLELPATAQKNIAEVLPYELEAQLPCDIEETIYDSHVLSRANSNLPIPIIAVVAKTDEVRRLIDSTKGGLPHEPERVDPAAFSLANLALVCQELMAEGPVGIAHLDGNFTDVLFMSRGQILFGRTVSGGTGGLPGSAGQLARDLRQTVLAFRANGGLPPACIYLAGPGATLTGAEAFLSAELGIPVTPLPTPKLEGLKPEQATDAILYSRALGAALGLTQKPRSFNLRRGVLSYERGYGFLREKVPLLVGLGALIAASFAFSTWLEYRALVKQHEVLEDTLAIVTGNVLGEQVRDPQRALDLVGPAKAGAEDDPMPRMDGFDVMVQISKAVPPDIKHDIEELDFQKGKATIQGIVPSIPDAQSILAALQTVPCFKNVKIVRTNQTVNDTRQKYVMELDVKCETDKDKDKDKDKKSGAKEVASSESKEVAP
jgi:general secretion pathway protein L